MNDTIKYTGELTVETCWCGMCHAVPSELVRHQQACHNDGREVPAIYCPLGHAWVLSGKPKHQIEQERRERAEAALIATRDQLEAEKKSHSATKGQLTKTRKRSVGGVCPCCNRSFEQLARHMKTKHPDFDPAA